MRVPNADPIGRGVVWARRIERVTSTVVNPRCSRMRLTCVYSVAAASRALCAWSADAAMPAPRANTPLQAKPKRRTFPPHETAGAVENVWLARLGAVFFNHCLLIRIRATFFADRGPERREGRRVFPSLAESRRAAGARRRQTPVARASLEAPRSHDARRGFRREPRTRRLPSGGISLVLARGGAG